MAAAWRRTLPRTAPRGRSAAPAIDVRWHPCRISPFSCFGAAGGRLEAGGRLVQEDELWVADEGEGEIEPAPLADRQPGAERARLSGETDQGDGLVDIPRRAVEPGAHGQALPDGQAGLGLGLRQDHAHPVPPRAARRGRVVPQDRNLSFCALPEAFEDLN